MPVDIDPAFARRAEFIRQAAVNGRPRRILDVGCGRGFHVRLMAEIPSIHEIVGVDTNDSQLRLAADHAVDEHVRLERADITHLPFDAGSFDMVICSEVLEHLPDDQQAVSELARVLRPGGQLVVTVPNREFPMLWDPLNWLLTRFWHTHVSKHRWWLAGIWADHERLYSASELHCLLRSHGLVVFDLKLAVRRCWPFSHFLLYGLGKNLLEHTSLFRGFDRYSGRMSVPARVLAWLMSWPDRRFPARTGDRASVSLMVLARRQTDAESSAVKD